MLIVTMVWSSSDNNAIHYVLTFLWMTSCLFAHNWPGKGDMPTGCILKLTHQEAAPGQSLMPAFVLFVFVFRRHEQTSFLANLKLMKLKRVCSSQ